MVMVRCMKESQPSNQIIRNEVVARMWEDVTERMKQLDV